MGGKKYTLSAQNCIDFVKAVSLNIAKLKQPSNSLVFEWPSLYLKELKRLNKAFDKVTPTNPTTAYQKTSETDVSLTEGAKLLFKDAKNKLSSDHKNQIFNSLGFFLTKDKKRFLNNRENEEYEPSYFDANVQAIDLDKDGTEEVFVHWGNNFTSGNVGKTVTLFIKSGETYTPNLGIGGYAFLTQNYNFGYPDLMIGGPGMTYPIWRWNGTKYSLHKRLDGSSPEYKKLKLVPLESIRAFLE